MSFAFGRKRNLRRSMNRITSVPVGVYLPKPMSDILHMRAKELKTSLSNLVAFAVGDQLVKPIHEQFKLYTKLPEHLQTMFDNATDDDRRNARTLYAFMSQDSERFYSREYLYAIRFLHGISSTERLAIAIELLITSTLVTEVRPEIRRNGYSYPDGYMVLKVNVIEEEKIDYTKRDKKVRKGEV